ncbi:MAG: T9SS type A sorting domain-containing protein, partial [bacterium]
RRTFAMEVSPATVRISLWFTADGHEMGGEYSTGADSVLFHVEASAVDVGFANARLYRNGTLIRQTGSASTIDWNTFDTPGPGTFHYQVIVTQSDGDNAWSSPIWVQSTSKFSVPIAQVNEDDAQGFPIMLFQTVTVQGLVTVDTDTLNTVDNQFFIQDATGGLMILETNVQAPAVVLGDNVLVTGFVNTVLGQTFIDPSIGDITIQSQGGAPPAATLLTTSQLAALGETWEGSLVELRDVAIVSGTWPAPGFNGTVMVNDGSGPCGLYIDKDTSLDDTGAPAEPTFSVRGLLVQQDPSTPYTSEYRIMPRYQSDIFQIIGVGVEELPSHHTATRTSLHQNSPNPFRPHTAIEFDVAGAEEQPVRLEVYDVTGRVVRTLVDEFLGPGSYETRWDARDGRGSRVAAGIYFYRLVTPTADETRKMVVLR